MARMEPQNLEAEMSVLCCAFLQKDALDKIIDEVNEDMFLDERNKLIFINMKKLHNDNIPIDVQTLCNELDKSKSLSKVGGIEYVNEVINAVPSAANLEYYIKIIFDKSVLRNIISTTNQIQEECYNESDDVVNIVENAERNILGIYKDRMGRDIKKLQEILPEVQKQIDTIVANKQSFTGIRTGYGKLDQYTNGLSGKQVIIIAGRPGCGKSAFALNIGLNAAINNKQSVALFSLEMGEEEIVKRMYGRQGRIDGDVLKTGKFKNTDWKRWNEATSQFADAKFYIDDSGGMTVAEIRRKARKLKNSSDGLDLLIIDYLQLLSSSNKYSGQRVQEVGEISRDLKKLAMELDIPVIALAQLSRSVEQRRGEDKKPKLSDLRESGSIEQDADIVLFLYSDEYGNYEGNTNRKIELLVAKNRSGQTGTVNLTFEMNTGLFSNYASEEEESNE